MNCFESHMLVAAEKYSDYFHVAPTTERQRIQQHGLQPSHPARNPRWWQDESWATGGPEDLQPPSWIQSQPEGVYVDKEPRTNWALNDADGKTQDFSYDIWRVPRTQVQTTVPDPVGGGLVIPHPVYPELHEGPEHRTPTSEYGRSIWDEDDAASYF